MNFASSSTTGAQIVVGRGVFVQVAMRPALESAIRTGNIPAMGSMQGDDLQLQGDLACENAEVRGQLKVGGQAVAPKAIVVYAPGLANPSAPFVNTWDAVESAVNAVDGACQLWIDMTGLAGFAQVPATADLDGKGRLEIIGKGPNGEAELVMADGAQIRNVQTFRTIVFRGRGNSRPSLLWDLDGMIVECFDATFLFDLVCTQPVMSLVAPLTYISFFFSHSSELRNSHNPGAAVLDVGAGCLCFLCIDTLFFPSSFDTTISGAATATLQLQVDGSLPVVFSFPAFAGTLSVSRIDNQPTPTVTGSRGGNAALASLLTGLAGLGLIIDNTTP